MATKKAASAKSARSTAASAETVTISHADKVLFPDDGITKGDLAAYYEAIAPAMTP